MYSWGMIAEQDYVKAMDFYERAYELGAKDAAISIGDMYKEGLGVEQDATKAEEWYAKAKTE